MRSGTKAKLQEILSDYPYFAERIPKLEGKQQALMMERRDAVERVLNKTNSSKRGQIVGDFFGGSGSTLIACEQLDRKCYTMELDPHYADVIIDRWQQLTDKQAVKISG